MMDEVKIQDVLQDALEDEIPAFEINLWPDVKANLVAGKQLSIQQGEKMNTIQRPRMLRFALAIAMLVILFGVFLLTPQGRTFAQSVFRFFTQTENTSFPLQPSQIVASNPDTAAATAVPPAPLISVPEAEMQVGFDVAELPFVPVGFEYLGARVYGNAITIEYETQDKGGHLIIRQSQGGFYQSDWDKVPADAVIPVKIGQSDGEFVQGIFVVYPQETSATWNPDAAILRLRWEMGGISFEITKLGDVAPIEYLDQAELIRLAEQLIFNP
jgi:hypothetical protein